MGAPRGSLAGVQRGLPLMEPEVWASRADRPFLLASVGQLCVRVFSSLLCSSLAKGSADVSLSPEGDAKTSQGPRGASNSAGGWGPHGDGSDAPSQFCPLGLGSRSQARVCRVRSHARRAPRRSVRRTPVVNTVPHGCLGDACRGDRCMSVTCPREARCPFSLESGTHNHVHSLEK